MKQLIFSQRRQKLLFNLAIFFSPFLALTFFTFFFGYAPLGSTPATASGDAQYMSYLSSLHSAIKGNGFFSFSELATDASHLHARYAGSPFTWLNALFPVSVQATVAFLLLAIKSGLAALCFSFYLKRRRPTLSSAFLFILSFSFALPACIGLTDGLALLPEQLILIPLLLLSLEKLFEKGNGGLLLFSLAFIFLTGYAVAYATLLFALLVILLDCIEGRITWTQIKNRIGRLTSAIFIAFLFALPILMLALTNLGAIGTVDKYSGSLAYRFPLLLLGFWPGVTIPEFPIFYIGLLPLLLFPLFFACRAFSRLYRISFGAILLILCTYFLFFNPFGGALAFGLSFLVLVLTADFLSSDSVYRKLPFTVTAAILLVAPMILQKLAYRVPSDRGAIDILSPIFGVYLPLGLLFIACLVLSSLLKKEGATRALTALLILLVITDGFATTFWRTSGKTFLETEELTQADYTEKMDFFLARKNINISPLRRARVMVAPPTKFTKQNAYLIGSPDRYALSPSLARLLSSLGADTNAKSTDAPFCVVDAILGTSYVLKASDVGSSLNTAHYKNVYSDDEFTLYKADALPLVFAASSDILSFKATKDAPMQTTNAFVSALLGETKNVYYPLLDTTVTKDNAQTTIKGTAPIAGTLCYYSTEIGSPNLNITVSNISRRPYEDGKNSGIIEFTSVEVDEEITVRQNQGNALSANTFYVADFAAFEETLTKLDQNSLKNPQQNGLILKGQMTLANGSVIMTSLPYDTDYTVTLNGKKAETVSVEGLLAVKASAGTHDVLIEREASFGVELAPTLIGLCGTLCACILVFVPKVMKKKEKSK